jgi:ferredoxin
MNQNHYTRKDRWDEAVKFLSGKFRIYAPISQWGTSDYQVIDATNATSILYNHPRPSTPLKTFYLPVRENVTSDEHTPETIILGVPNCDIQAMPLLDTIYMDEVFNDPYYRNKRASTYIIGTDCFEVADHCHCISYGIKPIAGDHCDINLAVLGDGVILKPMSEKGLKLVGLIEQFLEEEAPGSQLEQWLEDRQHATTDKLKDTNADVPDYASTGQLILDSDPKIWDEYAENCVSCGACTASCPTCTCFLLSDKPGFEKIRNQDACQYPGFEKVAAGEDPLRELQKRFKNRYLCKYVWKSSRFNEQACTGCGRCIDGCIGNIDKNSLFKDLAKLTVT